MIATAELESYLESFSEFEKRAAGHDQPWLKTVRQEAFARFCQVGLPTTHDEDWRFTNTAPIRQTAFRLVSGARVSRDQIASLGLPAAGNRLVFIDGRFVSDLSSIEKLPRGVKVNNLAKEIGENATQLEAHLARYLNIHRDAFSALNTAFLEDGAYVHVSRGTLVEEPIHFLFISTGGDTPTMSHPRNLFIAEEESQVTLVEEYMSLQGGASLCNTVTELVAKEGAIVSHYMIESEHTDAFNISTLRIEQERSANVASHSVLLGGGLVRNNVHPVLAGDGAECLINGLFVGNGSQRLIDFVGQGRGELPHRRNPSGVSQLCRQRAVFRFGFLPLAHFMPQRIVR